MVYTLSYQMYKSEHGLGSAEQRAADVRAGSAAAAVRDVRVSLGRVFHGRAFRGRALRGRAWEATAFVDNVADERGNTFAYGNPFTFGQVRQVTPQRPRTVGLRLAAGF